MAFKFVLIAALALVAGASATVEKTETCFNAVNRYCDSGVRCGDPADASKERLFRKECSPKFEGGLRDSHEASFRDFANTLISHSNRNLIIATKFGNYKEYRPGMQKLFRGIADEQWEGAIKMIKHIVKRGGTMELTAPEAVTAIPNDHETVARAVDEHIYLNRKLNAMHAEVSRHNDKLHDVQSAHFLEEEYSNPLVDRLRQLSGYLTDIVNLMRAPDASLGLYMFDEYLKKAL